MVEIKVNLLNDFVKDRFVTGLRKGPLLDRVCEDEPTAEKKYAVIQ